MDTIPKVQHPSAPSTLRFGIFEADRATGELRKNGRRLHLQEQPFQILVILLRRSGELVTREELVKTLWPDGTFVDYDHSLNTAVNKLREVLGDSATSPHYIETLPRRGYRFIGELKTDRQPEIEPSADRLPTTHRGLVRVLFLLAQVMYLGFYVAALVNLEEIHRLLKKWTVAGADPLAGLIVVTALAGIPLRFFLLTAVGFDYRAFGRKYARLYKVLVVMDSLWGLAPLLMVPRIGAGWALAVVAALLYLPFGQRTLVRMSYSD